MSTIKQVQGEEEEIESNLDLSSESDSRECFKLNTYQQVKVDQVRRDRKLIISQNANHRAKDFHALIYFKDICFFTEHIDDLYMIGTDIFNMIEIIQQFIQESTQELIQDHDKIQQQELEIEELSQQKKFQNLHIQEVQLNAMLEDIQELQDQRITLKEGFEPISLGSINIPDIEDSMNIVFMWCTIALYESFKEDYYWENFKQKVFRKETVDDFLQRLLYKKAAKMPKDQSILAEQIISKKEEFLNKKYLKKKQKEQLEILFNFIQVINESWTIGQDIRSKVVFFEQVQKEYMELEVVKEQHEAEKKIFSSKQKEIKQSLADLSQTNVLKQLELIVEEQQNSEQYLIYQKETSNQYFEYLESIMSSNKERKLIELEDKAFKQLNEKILPQGKKLNINQEGESELDIMEQNQRQEEGNSNNCQVVSLDTQLSLSKNDKQDKLLSVVQRGETFKQSDFEQEEEEEKNNYLNAFVERFDPEKELETNQNEREGMEEDDEEEGGQGQKEKSRIIERDAKNQEEDKNNCIMF